MWTTSDKEDTWEAKLAKRYYDKLFREYGICDLSLYEQGKLAVRWQTEKEVVSGKGQFSCAEKRCGYGTETEEERQALKTWEVNFGYIERGEKRNALVKLRLCPKCSEKLNYKTKRKEVTRKLKPKKKKKKEKSKVDEKPSEKEEVRRRSTFDILMINVSD